MELLNSHPVRHLAVAVLTALTLATACSDDDSTQKGSDPVDSILDPNNDDTRLDTNTRYRNGVLTVAGIQLHTFQDYEREPGGTTTNVPSSWPLLSKVSLWPTTRRFQNPQVGAGVLAQQELGRERAQEIIDAGFLYADREDNPLMSSGTVDGNGRECHWEHRWSDFARDFDLGGDAMIVVGGDEIASFAMYLFAGPKFDLRQTVAEVIEDVCGVRPKQVLNSNLAPTSPGSASVRRLRRAGELLSRPDPDDPWMNVGPLE